jgi:DNA-binding transcriptional regulator LsrR (DeoR family)
MADRSRIGPSHPVLLPMSRYDIADYLGLAVETVSRALTELRQRQAIAFRSARQVRICDRAALEEFAEKLAESDAHLSPHRPAALANRSETNPLSI